MDYQSYKEGLSESNCNARLDLLYKERDKVSERIGTLLTRGYDVTFAEAEYSQIADIINDLCIWRKQHPGCLLQGDHGYGV